MKITDKENNQFRIILNLDKKSYLKFLKEVKELGKKYEHDSNSNYLKYTSVISGIKTPDMKTGGWTNRCEDFKFIIFLDFDNIQFWQVQVQLEYLIRIFNLSPFYVFETESLNDENGNEYGSYNCVCLTKKKFHEVLDIQDETNCDQSHKHVPKIYRFKSHVLRNLPKGKKGRPKFKCVVGDEKLVHTQEVSSAHLDFLKKAYDVPHINYRNKDGLTKLWLSEYSTSSK